MELITLDEPTTWARAKILPGLGFNCFSWQVDWGGGLEELLWAEEGFETGTRRASGSGIPLLFPHPGRIAQGKFTFEAREYSLPLADGHPNALHGFVHTRGWRVEHADGRSAAACFQASVDDPEILKWWPSDFSVTAKYTLEGNSLVTDLRWRNEGESPLPYGVGTHTYFKMPLSRDSRPEQTVLTAPITHQWEFVDMLATGKLLSIPDDLRFGQGVTLGSRQFDDMYRLEGTRVIATSITDQATGRQVVQEFPASDFPNLVIYTPGHREALCMEPYSCAADPFRLEAQGIASGLRILQPEEEASTRITIAARQL